MSDTSDPISLQRQVELAMPSKELENLMAVRRMDWREVRRRVDRLRNPLESSSTWAATIFGVMVTAGLTLVLLVTSTEETDPWVVPFFALLTLFSGIVSLFMMRIHTKEKNRHGTDVDHVCAYMDEIEEHTPVAMPGGPVSDTSAAPPQSA